ncbi:MAG: HAD family phosphatase [Parvibaculum sp.]
MSLPAFDAVLFDMDGTLINTESLYMEEWVRAASLQGYMLTTDLWHQFLGRPTDDCLALMAQHFGAAFDVEAHVKEWRPRLASRLATEVPLMPGAAALVANLKSRGTRLAVATSATRESAHTYLKMAGLIAYFEHIVTWDDVASGKPAPDPFLLAAKRLGIAPANCLAIEDTEAGIRSAHAAGTVPIMVPSIKQPETEVRKLCHLVLNDLTELHALIT